MEDNIITIDKSKLVLAQNKAGEIILTIDAKAELEKILDAKHFIEELFGSVQDKLTEEMNARKLNVIVAGNIVVRLSPGGHKYSIKDKNRVDKKFLKTISYQIPNSEEISKILEVKGKLPEFTDFNLRKYELEIVRREEE